MIKATVAIVICVASFASIYLIIHNISSDESEKTQTTPEPQTLLLQSVHQAP